MLSMHDAASLVPFFFWVSSQLSVTAVCIYRCLHTCAMQLAAWCKGNCHAHQSVWANNSTQASELLSIFWMHFSNFYSYRRINKPKTGNVEQQPGFCVKESTQVKSLNPPLPFSSENVWLPVSNLLNSSLDDGLMRNQQPCMDAPRNKNVDALFFFLFKLGPRHKTKLFILPFGFPKM